MRTFDVLSIYDGLILVLLSSFPMNTRTSLFKNEKDPNITSLVGDLKKDNSAIIEGC